MIYMYFILFFLKDFFLIWLHYKVDNSTVTFPPLPSPGLPPRGGSMQGRVIYFNFLKKI
jgi:hypothetical protein